MTDTIYNDDLVLYIFLKQVVKNNGDLHKALISHINFTLEKSNSISKLLFCDIWNSILLTAKPNTRVFLDNFSQRTGWIPQITSSWCMDNKKELKNISFPDCEDRKDIILNAINLLELESK